MNRLDLRSQVLEAMTRAIVEKEWPTLIADEALILDEDEATDIAEMALAALLNILAEQARDEWFNSSSIGSLLAVLLAGEKS